jgi:hypothetical protein
MIRAAAFRYRARRTGYRSRKPSGPASLRNGPADRMEDLGVEQHTVGAELSAPPPDLQFSLIRSAKSDGKRKGE